MAKKKKRQIWDTLTPERETAEGGRYFKGSKGTYLFLVNGSAGGRIGKVMLNRKYLSGLFRSKYSSKTKRLCGDCREENKFLIFDETPGRGIVITWTDKQKHEN
jgi:hypothetical protein